MVHQLQVIRGHYVDSSDKIGVEIFNALSGAGFRIVGRFLNTNYDITPLWYQTGPIASDRSNYSNYWPIAKEGWILGVGVTSDIGAPQTGQSHCVLSIQRPPRTYEPLAQSYVAQYGACFWNPAHSSDEKPGEGPGYDRTVNSNPAAGSSVALSVPTNARWRYEAFFSTVVTDANVATRTLTFILDGSGATPAYFSQSAGATQAASLTRYYRFAPYVTKETAFDVNNIINAPIPSHTLSQTWRIRGSLNNIQTGDDLDSEHKVVEWVVPQ